MSLRGDIVHVDLTMDEGCQIRIPLMQVLHDYQLMLIVGVLVLIDLTAFVLREVLDTPRVVNTVFEKEVRTNKI